jgi:hypothetical protein
MPRSPRTSLKTYAQHHQDMPQTMYQNMYLKHTPYHTRCALSMYRNIQYIYLNNMHQTMCKKTPRNTSIMYQDIFQNIQDMYPTIYLKNVPSINEIHQTICQYMP